jgi:3-deoxy-D-manno-octulosonic-acid transferase
MQAAGRSAPVVVLVAVAAPDALVASRAEGPATVLRARPVAGEQHDADVNVLPRVVERAIQLVDRLRAEGVAHLGAVEGDTRDATGDVVVVAEVGELGEALDPGPAAGVEELGNLDHSVTVSGAR